MADDFKALIAKVATGAIFLARKLPVRSIA